MCISGPSSSDSTSNPASSNSDRISPAELLERCQGEALAADLRILADGIEPDPQAKDGTHPEQEIAAAVLEHARACLFEEQRFSALAEAARASGIGCTRVAEQSAPLDRLDGLIELASQLTDGEPRR